MIEFIQANLTTILGGTAIGAFIGGVVGLVANGSNQKALLSEAVGSEARTLIEAISRVRDGMGATQAGFGGILAMLIPDTQDSNPEDDLPQDILPDGMDIHTQTDNTNTDQETVAAPALDGSLATKLLAAVLAIPALPKLPDLAGNFETLRDNELFSVALDQLSNLDTNGLNTMLDEFKTLMETTLQPGLDKAAEDGFDFILEPETIETVTRSAREFMKAIGGMHDTVGSVVDMLTKLINN